ncbi:hypothetical protein P170DRAFT_478249 [Aspergillus steynii IBT 23096]|uniref:NAD(P)-binding protein n=1 Tax=Aspergillus steynii IBT 23096 TaxID=1392250 RepID=A0A2I2G3E7_9EURO|nr:uncharacterized protein P170DRAFT_478249 [Aspergillus steynii IBT 23096]PLB47400.1 hypothetical protein P170DRAFT_478249 [Aspergillus steynii IBT 23096]
MTPPPQVRSGRGRSGGPLLSARVRSCPLVSARGRNASTTLQLAQYNGRIDQWNDKLALVTGATSGIGLEAALALYATSAHVFIAARDPRGKSAVKYIRPGIMATPYTTTADGVQRQFAVNQLAYFTLSAMLLPTVMASSSGDSNLRIVQISSASHRCSSIDLDINYENRPYDPYLSYGQSNTAMI